MWCVCPGWLVQRQARVCWPAPQSLGHIPPHNTQLYLKWSPSCWHQTLVSCHTSDQGTYQKCQFFEAFITSTDSRSWLSSTCLSQPSSAYPAYFTARTARESQVLRSSAILADFFSMVALHPSWWLDSNYYTWFLGTISWFSNWKFVNFFTVSDFCRAIIIIVI